MWTERVREHYADRKKEVCLAGGQKKIDKQHNDGKLTARERLELLFDGHMFNEIEMYATSRDVVDGINKKHYLGDGVICAYGKVNGKTVYAVSQDATISGGAGSTIQLEKMCRTLERAIETKSAYVCLCESGGARIEEGILSLSAYSKLFLMNERASGYIPQIAAIMGNCAGGSSYSPAMCDFLFMVKKTGQLFITGPKVVKAMTGAEISMEDLGGFLVHSRDSGQAHFISENDEECIKGVRTLLDYIQNKILNTGEEDITDYHKLGQEIENIVPENKRRSYDVMDVVKRIVDRQEVMEVLRDFAQNIVTVFARMHGNTVGIIANQPKCLGGALDCDAADKCARFVRFCDCFDIPIITLVDVPGYMPGDEQEKKGILRHGSKILYAFAESSVPKISVILRKAYGGAYCAMNSKALGADIVFAWPICEFAVMGPDSAVDVIFHKQLEKAEDYEALRSKLIKDYEEKYLDPYFAATCGMVDEVIFPEETRFKIIKALDALQDKKVTKLEKKHGNIPL